MSGEKELTFIEHLLYQVFILCQESFDSKYFYLVWNKNPLWEESSVVNRAFKVFAEWNAVGSDVEEVFGMKLWDLTHRIWTYIFVEWMSKLKAEQELGVWFLKNCPSDSESQGLGLGIFI